MSRFVITREDRAVAPVAVTAEILRIGRSPDCELVLSHPEVSRLHASIRAVDGHFHLYSFSRTTGTTLNGHAIPIEEGRALADGDVLQVGPYFLYVNREEDALYLRVMQVSTFVVERKDRSVDPVTVVTEGLRVGRAADCELLLNHPEVSPLHAGIREADGRFYISNFSQSNATVLNGRVLPVEEAEELAGGDVVQIGPFFLTTSREEAALKIQVSRQVAVHAGEAEARGETKHAQASHAEGHAATAPSEVSNALGVFWASRKREAGKMHRLSPLRPHAPSRVLGKARFNWTPTRDLVRPWPVSVFVWGAIVVAALSIVAALSYTSAFSPAPLSEAHTRASLTTTPAIAREPNTNSCTTCHTLTAKMETNCASCHRVEGFHATVTRAHVDAGISCVSCHAEHRGADFNATAAAHATCSECHNDQNQKLFNGKRVFTPHGGTFGYPVRDGKWVWKGLDKDEWDQRPVEVRQAVERWPAADDNQRRSAQFHALHLHRVRVVGGLKGNEAGEMSCSSCHASFFPAVDRETPRTTCAKCHNGDLSGASLVAANAPNCNSCHVQHTQDKHTWASPLLVEATTAAR